jgi:hypothetical protein
MDLNALLTRTADRVVADGTAAAAPTLEAMASAAAKLNQGAAAALVDWNGSEIARLRAFGFVHGVLLRDLPHDEQSQLLSQLLDISSALVLEDGPSHAQPNRKKAFATSSMFPTGAAGLPG